MVETFKILSLIKGKFIKSCKEGRKCDVIFGWKCKQKIAKANLWYFIIAQWHNLSMKKKQCE